MLARDLLERMELARISAAGLDLPEIDITDPKHHSSTFDAAYPDILVNSAAYTAVDRAESEPGYLCGQLAWSS